MMRDELRPDPELRRMLRSFDGRDHATGSQRAALVRRIAAGAERALAGQQPHALAWWDVAAGWAHALVPLGVATAILAAALIVWTVTVTPPRSVAPVPTADSLVSLVPHDRTSQDLLDLIVSPSAAPEPLRAPAAQGQR